MLVAACILSGCREHHHYEIRTGTYDEANVTINGSVTGTTETRHGVFRIDTETGRTWLYRTGTVTGTNGVTDLEQWREIPEARIDKVPDK